jgi:hypothetical protein
MTVFGSGLQLSGRIEHAVLKGRRDACEDDGIGEYTGKSALGVEAHVTGKITLPRAREHSYTFLCSRFAYCTFLCGSLPRIHRPS